MPNTRKFLRFFQDRTWNNPSSWLGMLADLLAILGLAEYAQLLWTLAHNQISVLDEGLYLYKGWLFSTGRFNPFQAYGPWTNQMPLAFLIPGWVEELFGPGLRTGRIMAVVLGLLMLLGLWLTARRLGSRWVAAVLVWIVVLNPAAARMYALAVSQGLVACILAWTMWFSLGHDRKSWQLMVGGLLAGCAVMVRINLLPLLPLLTIYVLWARGWKIMLWTVGGMLVSFGGLHLFYWPDILQLWAKWLPFGFLQPWFPPRTIPTWNPDNPIGFRIASFFLAFRYHFAALAGTLAAWIFWPKRENITPYNFKTAVFLSFLLFVFFLLHAWAALGNEYCVFCFPTYTAFYAGVGLLLSAVTLPGWNLNPPTWRKWLGSLIFVVMLAGMAFSAEGAAEKMLGELFYKRLLAIPLPGLNETLLWQVIANKFQLEYKNLYDTVHLWFPILVTMTIVVVVLAVFFGLGRKSGDDRGNSSNQGLGTSCCALSRVRIPWGVGIVFLLCTGSLFAIVPVVAGDYTSYDCESDVIPAYEAAGALLAKSIPAGSKIFWAGYSPVTLLYLPDAQIYPSQLHGAYSFRISTDDNALLKYGWWNEHLGTIWLKQTDFILAEQKNLEKNDWLSLDGRLDYFNTVLQTKPQTCQDNSAMLLYRRK